LEKCKATTMYIVEWKTFGQDFDQIFSMRANTQTPIIVYAKPGEIPREKMSEISMISNTVVDSMDRLGYCGGANELA